MSLEKRHKEQTKKMIQERHLESCPHKWEVAHEHEYEVLAGKEVIGVRGDTHYKATIEKKIFGGEGFEVRLEARDGGGCRHKAVDFIDYFII